MDIFLEPSDCEFQAGLLNIFPSSRGLDSPGKTVEFLCSKATSHLLLLSAGDTQTNIHKQ